MKCKAIATYPAQHRHIHFCLSLCFYTTRRVCVSIFCPKKNFLFLKIYRQHFALQKRCTYWNIDRSGEVIVDTIGRELLLAAKPRS
jgi:hypothetical protein